MAARIVHARSAVPLDEAFLQQVCSAAVVAAGEKARGIQRVASPGGGDIAVKVGRGSSSRRATRGLCGLASRSASALRVAEVLLANSVLTPAPRAVWEQRGMLGVVVHDVFVCDYAEASTLEDSLRADVSRAFDRIEQCADVIYRMHSCRVVHRDLKASNLLVVGEGAASCVYVTDLDGARVGWRVPTPGRRARDLGRLWVSLDALGADADALLAAYAKCAGWGDDRLAALRHGVDSYRVRKTAQNQRRGRELR